MKRGNLPRKINYKPPNVPWTFQRGSMHVSLMTSPLRDCLDILLMVAFNYLEGISKLLYAVLKWPEEDFLTVFISEQKGHSGKKTKTESSRWLCSKKVTQNSLQLVLFATQTLMFITGSNVWWCCCPWKVTGKRS